MTIGCNEVCDKLSDDVKKWCEKAYSPAYILIVMILTIGTVMLLYTLFSDFVTQIFYNIAMNSGASSSTAGTDMFDYIVWMWEYSLIIVFVISLVIWAIVNSMREERMA